MAHAQKYLESTCEAAKDPAVRRDNESVFDWVKLRQELSVSRIRAHLDEGKLAQKMGVSPSTVYRIEKVTSAKHNPGLDVVASWVESCGSTLSEFFEALESGRVGPIMARGGLTASDKNSAKSKNPATFDNNSQDFTAEPVASNVLTRGHANAPAPLSAASSEDRLAHVLALLGARIEELSGLLRANIAQSGDPVATRLVATERADRATRKRSPSRSKKPGKQSRKSPGAA